MNRKAFFATSLAAAALAACIASAAQAADFPTRPVRIVVPYFPGGANDLIARLIAPKMQERLGQPVVVENRPGAGGNTGTEAVARAEPDGYSTVVAANFVVMTPLFAQQPGYTLADLAPLGRAATQPVVVAVNSKSPVNTMKELIDAARNREKGKELTYGTPGIGTPHHFFVEQFARKLGINLVHVPYKGAAPVVADLVAGRIDFAFGSETTSLPATLAGQLRQIAVLDDRRMTSLPNLPTSAESGAPGVKASFWYGLFAPAKTPATVVAQLNRALNDILATADMQAQLRQRGYVPSEPRDPQAFMADLRAELAEWEQLAKSGFRIRE